MHHGRLALLIAAGVVCPPAASAARYENRLVDLPPAGESFGAITEGQQPSVSGDGRYVAFASDDADLSEQCKAGPAVYVRDLLGRPRPLPARRLRECALRTEPTYRDGRDIYDLFTYFNRAVRARYVVYRGGGRSLSRVRSGPLPTVDGSAGYFSLRFKTALAAGRYSIEVDGRDARGHVASQRASFRVLAARRR